MSVGGEPIGITEGFGSVWVVNSEFLSGGEPAVYRIDPATNVVTATIPVGDVPLETTAGFGSIWVSNSESDTVSRIDPQADLVVATIDVCDAPEGFAIGGGSVWVVCENSGRVGIIDPSNDRMVGTVRVGDEPRFATFAFGSVWVSNYAGSSVSRIDPAKAKVIATVSIDFGGQILTAFDGTDQEKQVTISFDMGDTEFNLYDFQVCYESPTFTLDLLPECYSDYSSYDYYSEAPCVLDRSEDGSIVSITFLAPRGRPEGVYASDRVRHPAEYRCDHPFPGSYPRARPTIPDVRVRHEGSRLSQRSGGVASRASGARRRIAAMILRRCASSSRSLARSRCAEPYRTSSYARVRASKSGALSG